MKTKGESILLKSIALLLFLGIIVSGVRVYALLTNEGRLDALDRASDGASHRLRDVLAVDPSALSEAQRRRHDQLRRDILISSLIDGLSVTTSNGATVPASATRPTGVSASRAALDFTIPDGSELNGLLKSVALGEIVAPFENGVATLEVPVSGAARFTPRFTVREFDVTDERVGFLLAEDRRPPEISFTRDGTLATRQDGDRLDLEADEPLVLRVDDDTLLETVEWLVFRDGADAVRTRPTLEPSGKTQWSIDYGGEVLHESDVRIEVTVTDTAGLVSKRTCRIARWKRPPPTVDSVSIHGQPGGNGVVVLSETPIDVGLVVETLHPETSLDVEVDGSRAPLIDDGERFHAASVPLGKEWNDLVFFAESDGWRTEIARARVRVDRLPPVITLLDAEGTPMIGDDLEVAQGARLEVHVADDIALAQGGVEVKRGGRIGLSSPEVARTEYRRPIRVDAPSSLTILAQDSGGNTARRVVRFETRSALPPDDGKGPTITVRCGDVPLTSEAESVLVAPETTIEIAVADAAGVSDLRIEGTRGGPYSGDGPWSLDVEGPVTITAVDGYGHRVTRRYPITVVNELPRITRLDDTRVPDGERIVELGAAPSSFRFVTPDGVPEGHIAASLMDGDGRTTPIDVGSGGGSLPDILDAGTWSLILSVKSARGLHEAHRVTFAITSPTRPTLVVLLAGKEVPAGSPVRVASLDELLIKAPRDADIRVLFDGAPMDLAKTDGGWRAGNPTRSAKKGDLLVRVTSGSGATTEQHFQIAAAPFRLPSDLVLELARGEDRIASGDISGAQAIVARVEKRVVAELASRLDRSRGVEFAKLDNLRSAIEKHQSGSAPSKPTAEPQTPSVQRPPEIVNRRDGARLVPVQSESTAFLLYETEVSLEMFRKFLEETLYDDAFWALRELRGKELGRFRETMRSLYLKSDDKKEWPARDMRGEWAEAYAAWAATGIEGLSGVLRLPTVEEWTLAATAGSSAQYPMTAASPSGSDVGGAQNRACANWNSGRPRPVGWYDAARFELRDMAGNVCELCRGRDADSELYLAGGSYLSRRKSELAIQSIKRYAGSKTEPRSIGFRLLYEVR